MKKRASVVALLLCVLTVLSAFAGCQPAGDSSNTSVADASNADVSTSVDGWNEELQKWETNLPAFKWDAKNETYKTFDVAVTSNEIQSTYFSEDIGYEYDTTDAAIKDAVMNRNNLVTQQTGVEIKAIYVKDVLQAVRDDVAIGKQEYDMAMPFIYGAVNLAQEGTVMELTDETFAEYLHLDMPWWDQNANDAFSVDERLYFTTGDITIMTKINTWAITFNKDMFADLFQGENLYEIVEAGEWTFDKLVSYAKQATMPVNGVYDMNSQWGLISAWSDARNYFTASGATLADKDAGDIPMVDFGSDERAVTIAQNILSEFANLNSWHIYTNTLPVASPWVTCLDMFAGGQVLFRTSVFSAIKKLRNYEDGIEFGVVPMPKYDSDQEKYYSPSDPAGYAIVIPKNAKDPEFSAYMTELLCCEAKNTLTPAYYETTLKYRDMRDDESAEMLDLIFDNKKYDIGVIYNFGGIADMMYKLSSTGSSEVASHFESISGEVEKEINDTVENFRD